MVGALGPDALNFITEARRQGVPESFPFLAGTTVFDGEVPERGGKAVNNLFGGIIWYKEMTSAKNQRMVKGFQDWIPRFYSNLTNSPNAFAVSAYDAVYMIKEAIEKMGVTNNPKDLAQDRTKIKDYLAKLRNFEGVASKGFDEDGDGLKNVYVQKTWNGTWQLVKEWGPAQ
jgi:ABC-type branched-subunit amino acid transport system substrate-binding protein